MIEYYGKVVIFGGQTNGIIKSISNDIYQFDLFAVIQAARNPLLGIENSSSFLDKMNSLGGNSGFSGTSGQSSLISLENSLKIVKLQELNVARHHFAFSVIDEKLLIYGGISENTEKLESFEIYDLSNSRSKLFATYDQQQQQQQSSFGNKNNDLAPESSSSSSSQKVINIQAQVIPIRNYQCNFENNKLTYSSQAAGWLILGGYDSVDALLHRNSQFFDVNSSGLSLSSSSSKSTISKQNFRPAKHGKIRFLDSSNLENISSIKFCIVGEAEGIDNLEIVSQGVQLNRVVF